MNNETEFDFVDDVWTDQAGLRLRVELSENGGHVRLVLHGMESGPVAELSLTNYRMRRIGEGLEKAWAAKNAPPGATPEINE